MLIFFEPSTSQVVAVHYESSDLPQEVIDKGIIVDAIPEPEVIAGKAPVMCYNETSKTVYYKYVDRALTPEERIAQLEAEKAEQAVQIMAISTDLQVLIDYLAEIQAIQ